MIGILHLDDDPMMHLKTRISLGENPFGLDIQYETALNDSDFFGKLRLGTYRCLLLDIMLGHSADGGLEVLKRVRGLGFAGTIIMFTTMADARVIAMCAEAGADDFVTKGLTEVELAFRITQAIKTPKLPHFDSTKDFFAGETLRKVRIKLDRVLNSSLRSVLVFGESGTGKEAVGKIVESLLATAKKPFVSINCGCIPSELIESEFFGHRKGAFTGATNSKEGYFSQANGGWLFLDEIGNLSYAAQAALLRVLETGEMRPVGGQVAQHVDVRVLAATNVDLDEKVKVGEFRGDLLQRLRSYEIFLPPLRARLKSEIAEILDHLIERLNRSQNGLVLDSVKDFRLTQETRMLLLAAKWEKGNVREMWHTLQAASIDTEEGLITVAHLPRHMRRTFLDEILPVERPVAGIASSDNLMPAVALEDAEPIARSGATAGDPPPTLQLHGFHKLVEALKGDIPLDTVMDEVEKIVIGAALKRHANRNQVYMGLGISRSSLNQKRLKYNL